MQFDFGAVAKSEDGSLNYGRTLGRALRKMRVKPVNRLDPARKRQLVVVAEDERHDWEIYGKLLWYNGFDVIHAEDGEKALQLIRTHLPDLIILDLMLPKVDGLEICRRVKAESPTDEIPVIALSARSEREYGSRARAAGFTDYLEKPIGPLAVLRTVEGIIGRPPPAGLDGQRPYPEPDFR